MDAKARFQEQLRRVGRLTAAKWAAWLVPLNGQWQIETAWGLTAQRRPALAAYLEAKRWRTWLSGALVQGRRRSRAVAKDDVDVLGARIHAFPLEQRGVLLVGAGPLDASARQMWRVVALGAPGETSPKPAEPICEQFIGRLAESKGQVAQVARAVVETVRVKAPSLYAYLAVLEGRTWRVLAADGAPVAGWSPQSTASERLAMLTPLQTGHLVTLPDEPWPEGPRTPGGPWVGIPLQQGRRLIGFLALRLKKGAALSPALEQMFTTFAHRVVWLLEQALAFEETTEHLRRKAVLNDVLLAMLSSDDVEAAAQNATRHLRRVLQADVAMVMLPTADGMLEPVGMCPAGPLPSPVPIEASLCGRTLQTGQAVCVGDVRQVTPYFPLFEDIRSELCVPLKSRTKVIGVLNLESTRPDAFTEEDQRLLMAVAGHLALMLEVLRLREETAARAQRMELVHQVIKEVVGLLDAQQVVEVAARRIAAYFGYEIAVVVVADEHLKRPMFYGVAGAKTAHFVPAMEAATWPPDGVIAHVLATGRSRLVVDTEAEPLYRFFPGFEAGSELCVPLFSHESDENVVGFINIERAKKYAFTEEDKMAMEAIAGALSAVLSSALRYQQLENTIRHLEATRQTALDIISDLEMDTLLQRIVKRVKHLLGVRGVEIGLVDREKGEVRIAAADTPQGECDHVTMPLGWGIGGRVAVSGQTLVVDDYATWSGREEGQKSGLFHAVASVPLKFADEVLGVLTVYDDDPARQFAADEVRLLEALAPQIAVALRNARLYRELSERMARQQRAEEELMKAGRLAAMGETAISIAHKLNAPLTTVLGFAELLLEDASPGSAAYEDLQLILREARRARDAVQELLDFARYPEPYQIVADANTLLKETLSLVSQYMASRGVTLHLSLQDDLPFVVVDPGEVKYVFLNLIHTLLQTMPHGGRLYVTTSIEEDNTGRWVVVRVADTGEAIKPEQMEKLFEPFYVAPKDRQARRTAMSYGVVQEDRNTFTVGDAEREPLGNVFAVYLPAM